MKLVLLGIQGAGKSTQGNMLAAKYGLSYLSSGHVFRMMAKEKTKLGRWLKETMNSGALVPDDMVTRIINEYLDHDEYTKGFILDGYPRTLTQAKSFEKYTNGEDIAIFIDVSDKEALWRISGRISDREDETIHAIRRRIELFHEKTEPVIDFYRKRGKLIEVNGEQTVEKVFEDIVKGIEKMVPDLKPVN